MSKPIEVGDLTVIVNCHCSNAVWNLGVYGVVTLIRAPHASGAICGSCHTMDPSVTLLAEFDDGTAYPVEWLKRVPPQKEPARSKQRTPEKVDA